VAGSEGEKTRVSRVTGNFNQVARDLERAMVAARFAPAQALLLQQAREESYTRAKVRGLSEPLPFRVNFSALARALGFHRTHLNEQFVAMVARRVFVPVGDSSYLINKDYRQWADAAGRPLLSPGAVAWCGQALGGKSRRRGASEKTDTPLQPTRHPVAADPTPPVGENRHPLSVISDTPLQPTRQVHFPPQTPVEERARGRESKERDKKSCRELGESAEGSPSGDTGPALRDPEDGHAVNQAVDLLQSDLRTHHVGMELSRRHNLPEVLPVPGWKFLRAARILLGPGVRDGARKSWPYFVGIVRDTEDADRDRPLPWEDRPRRSKTAEKTRQLVEAFTRQAEEAERRAKAEAEGEATDGQG
jgi:hypothetical protein